jgi:hypothetical protein
MSWNELKLIPDEFDVVPSVESREEALRAEG